MSASPRAPRWIRTAGEMGRLAADLGAARAVAIDTEADSLHHYPGKLCLVQVATDTGGAHLVDPLALADLSALGPALADPRIVKIFHAADNDLGYLKRQHAFAVASVFDTSIAARFLGVTALGLDVLLKSYLDVDPGKSRQKDDWSRRPLTAEQETYALNDVVHLFPLRDRLAEELAAKGRLAWLEEECAALAAQSLPPRVSDPDAYLTLKGTKDLDRRGLAVLRELFRERERLALELDRPPFMILGHDTLVLLAARRPTDVAALLEVPGCTPKFERRFGAAILGAVARGLAVPEAELPVRTPKPRPNVPGPVRRRIEALRAWRTKGAAAIGLDPGFFFPQRLIDRLAATPPSDLDALARTDGIHRWRAEVAGAEILQILRTA
jgi:ribonuclease D